MTSTLTPLRKSITVPWTREVAFRRFTEQISEWWPLKTHSVGGKRTERVVFEGRVGGRIYEVVRGGEEHTWGTVTRWEPPLRVDFTWHPGMKPETSQQIELQFLTEVGATRVELTHTGWERLGDLARRARNGYPIGWAYVLLLYADRRSNPLVFTLNAVMGILRAVERLTGSAKQESTSGSRTDT
jgi:uncharacterized protein YndB with AHSA1/START domain